MQCTPSIVCEPKYEHLAAGVISIYAVDPQSRTVGLCSGEPAAPCTAAVAACHLGDYQQHHASGLAAAYSAPPSFQHDLLCVWTWSATVRQ